MKINQESKIAIKKDISSNIAAIDKFLADNPELEDLSAMLSTFNVFRALKIEQAEIRHSNVLAWLLDPEETHGLSDIVIRRLLSNILLLSDKIIPGITASRLELLDFAEIEVRREWKNIDILVIDHINKFVCVIENKINSGESEGQLAKYKHIIEDEFADYIVIPVFLTLSNQEPSVSEFICYSHTQILAVLSKIIKQRQNQLSEPIRFFLNQYIETVRRLTMQDEELTELCKTIYRKHREAIDLIVQYGMVSPGEQAVNDVLKNDGDYEILYSGSSSVWFLPKSWSGIIPENGIAWTSLKRPVSLCCWFEFYKSNIYIHFEISKMNDPSLRLKCVNYLKEAGYSLSSKAFDENATYSRFYGKNVKINDMTDYNQVYEGVEKLLKKAKEEFEKVESILRNIFQQ
jgi:hypothetical protein